MKLLLLREPSTPLSTLGCLFVDSQFECFVLEDPVREAPGPVEQWKVKGHTAIPYGTYNVVITESARFKRPLPLLENVKGFTGIRIHPGNTAEDTEGCLLPGRKREGHDTILESKLAFEALFTKIQVALASGQKVSIEIRPLP